MESQSSMKCQKRKKNCLGCKGEWYKKHVQCPAWGKICFNCQNIFQDSAKINSEQSSHNTCKNKTHQDISLYRVTSNAPELYVCKLDLNGISCKREIDTRCSSLLSEEQQFKKLSKAMFSKKGLIQRLHTYFLLAQFIFSG